MAKLRDAVFVVKNVGVVPFAKKVWAEIGDDNLLTWASALAYSWLFAIFPFFLVLLSMLPLLKYEWKDEAKRQINNAINELPHEAKITVHQYVDPKLNQLLYNPPKGIWGIGLLVTVWAASGGMAMTMSALDKTWDVERSRPIWKQRPLAVALTLIVATAIIVVIILTSFVSRIAGQRTELGVRRRVTRGDPCPDFKQ